MPGRQSVTVTTWNINSVRLRIDLVARFLKTVRPDVLCLQETKCPDEQFPLRRLKRLGYPHVAVNGQKGYHGVAIISRLPFAATDRKSFGGKADARHVAVTLGEEAGLRDPIKVHNFYVPAGGDEPDPEINPKFAHKLAFLDDVSGCAELRPAKERAILVGDLNVAPLEHDVWSDKALLNVVSHTPVEVEKLKRAQAAGPWVDALRKFVPDDQKLYTWWSYRARDWAASDRGRRLDHIWGNEGMAQRALGAAVLKDARGWTGPSDHVPVTLDFAA